MGLPSPNIFCRLFIRWIREINLIVWVGHTCIAGATGMKVCVVFREHSICCASLIIWLLQQQPMKCFCIRPQVWKVQSDLSLILDFFREIQVDFLKMSTCCIRTDLKQKYSFDHTCVVLQFLFLQADIFREDQIYNKGTKSPQSASTPHILLKTKTPSRNMSNTNMWTPTARRHIHPAEKCIIWTSEVSVLSPFYCRNRRINELQLLLPNQPLILILLWHLKN